MGGTSELADKWLMGGQTERFGDTYGRYDSGQASIWCVVREGGLWGAQLVSNAMVAGKAVNGLRFVTGFSKGAVWKGSARTILGERGFAAKGQWVHHAFIEQKYMKGNKVLSWLANQPWNLKPLDPKLAAQLGGGRSGFSKLSNLAHGNTLNTGETMGAVTRILVATPDWVWPAAAADGLDGVAHVRALIAGGGSE
jgi:hypothetical protein